MVVDVNNTRPCAGGLDVANVHHFDSSEQGYRHDCGKCSLSSLGADSDVPASTSLIIVSEQSPDGLASTLQDLPSKRRCQDSVRQ